MDPVRVTKFLLVLTSFLAAWAVALQAQGGGGGINVNLRDWTPSTVLAVMSVVFSFGISWQTIRVHGKLLKDLEGWRLKRVEPALEGHAIDIAKLQVATGTLPPRGKHGRR